MKKRLPIAVQNFKEMIKDNYYYVDKTKFIEEIFTVSGSVKLFTRPRRFGKTLSMSMLDCFFNIANAKENRELFKGLYIENSPVFEEQGQYPVIFISMKGITGVTFADMMKKLRTRVSLLFERYIFLKEYLEEVKQEFFEGIRREDEKQEYSYALLRLSLFLKEYYGKKVIVLIDEYDAPLLSAYKNGYYNEAVTFFSTFYSEILKNDDESLEKAVLTGITKIAQAGIFSGLNNIQNYTVLNEDYDEYFGFVESEVIDALEYYDLKDTLDQVKLWYDGYKFGNTEVYNPISILKYMGSKKMKAYWVNTSEDFKLKEYLENLGYKVVKNLEKLINGDSIRVTITEHTSLGKDGKLDEREFWQLMLFSGYLTVKESTSDTRYQVRIPNEEVKSFFKDKFVEIIFNGLSRVDNIAAALLDRDIPSLITALEETLLQLPSYFDTAINNENAYHMLILGLSWGMKDYIPHSNLESGYGRADLMLQTKTPNYPSYIFEFKIKDKDNKIKNKDKLSLEKKAKIALKQIVDNKYDTFLIKEGIPKEQIVQIGFAFDGKKMVAYYEEEDN